MLTEPEQPSLRPEDVAARVFGFARRGYEPREVQAFLHQVADELRVTQRHALDLERHLEVRDGELARARDVDEAEMVRMLGAETVRVLDAAREAANQVRARAEQEAADLLADAERDAAVVRDEADQVLERRRAEADEDVADRLRQAAEALQEAQAAAAEAVARAEADGEAHLELVRERGREMVAEAQAVRERMLRDLSRRRKALRNQIDQLQAARDRLLAAYEVVRRTTDEASGELEGMLDAARDAAREAAENRPPSLGDADADIIAVIEAVRAERQAELGVGADVVDGILEDAEASPTTTGTVQLGDLGPRAFEPDASDDGAGAEGPEPDAADDDPEAGAAELGASDDEGSEADGPVLEAADDGSEAGSAELDVADDGSEADGTELEAADDGSEDGSAELDAADDGSEDGSAESDAVDGAAAELEASGVAAADADADEADEPWWGEGDEPTAAGAAEGPARAGADTVSIFARLRQEQDHGTATTEVEPDEGRRLRLVGDAPHDDVDEDALADDVEDTAADEDDDDDALWLSRRDEALAEVERTLARRLKRTVADEQNEVLDVLRRHRGRVELDLVFPALDVHRQRYADAALPTLAAAAAAGAEFVRQGWPELAGAAPRTRVGDVAEDLAAEVVGPLRDAVQARLGEHGEDLDALDEALRATYREWRAEAPDVAARRAASLAFHRAVADQVVPGTRLRWVVADETCAANAAATVALGEAFPDGSTAPPTRPGCRCLVVPAAS